MLEKDGEVGTCALFAVCLWDVAVQEIKCKEVAAVLPSEGGLLRVVLDAVDIVQVAIGSEVGGVDSALPGRTSELRTV